MELTYIYVELGRGLHYAKSFTRLEYVRNSPPILTHQRVLLLCIGFFGLVPLAIYLAIENII